MPGCRRWTRDPVHGFRVFKPERVPELDLRSLPANVDLTIPPDGGFWLIDRETGIRYRRVTMADLPKGVTFNTRGKAEVEGE